MRSKLTFQCSGRSMHSTSSDALNNAKMIRLCTRVWHKLRQNRSSSCLAYWFRRTASSPCSSSWIRRVCFGDVKQTGRTIDDGLPDSTHAKVWRGRDREKDTSLPVQRLPFGGEAPFCLRFALRAHTPHSLLCGVRRSCPRFCPHNTRAVKRPSRPLPSLRKS